MANAIEGIGGDARVDSPAHFLEGLRSEATSDSHPFDGLHILDLGPGEALRRGSIDVLGTRNMDGDGPTRGLDSGDERRPRNGHDESLGVSVNEERRR